MKKEVILVENGKGNFDLRKFGVSIAGNNGDAKFDLVIRSSDYSINLTINNVCIDELFERFDTSGKDFNADKYTTTDIIEVLETQSGYHFKTTKKILNLFKISDKSGRLINNSNCQAIAIFGNKEFFVLNSTKKQAA